MKTKSKSVNQSTRKDGNRRGTVVTRSMSARDARDRRANSHKKTAGSPFNFERSMEGFPSEMLNHILSSLHPVNRTALRRSSKKLSEAVKKTTKRNALISVKFPFITSHYPEYVYNKYIMNTSQRRYMTHKDAEHYLQQMFEHKGNGDLFSMDNPLIPDMGHIQPTDAQRKQLAKAITDDKSDQGRKYMYRLIKKILSMVPSGGSMYVHPPASMFPPGGSAVFVLPPASMANVSRHEAPNREKVFG